MADEPTSEDISEETITKAIDEEKKNYSLADRIAGIRRKTAKVVIFLDTVAVEDYNNQNVTTQMLARNAESTLDENGDELKGNALTDARARRLVAFNAAEEELFRLRDVMLENALSFHMEALPNVAVQKCLRQARADFPTLDNEPDDSDASKQQDENRQGRYDALLVHAATAVVAQVKGKPSKPSLNEILELQSAIDRPQWDRLVTSMQSLVFLDSVRQQATDDPGF